MVFPLIEQGRAGNQAAQGIVQEARVTRFYPLLRADGTAHTYLADVEIANRNGRVSTHIGLLSNMPLRAGHEVLVILGGGNDAHTGWVVGFAHPPVAQFSHFVSGSPLDLSQALQRPRDTQIRLPGNPALDYAHTNNSLLVTTLDLTAPPTRRLVVPGVSVPLIVITAEQMDFIATLALRRWTLSNQIYSYIEYSAGIGTGVDISLNVAAALSVTITLVTTDDVIHSAREELITLPFVSLGAWNIRGTSGQTTSIISTVENWIYDDSIALEASFAFAPEYIGRSAVLGVTVGVVLYPRQGRLDSTGVRYQETYDFSTDVATGVHAFRAEEGIVLTLTEVGIGSGKPL